MKEEMREAKGESRKPDTEAEGLAWCLALHRKIQRKRQGPANAPGAMNGFNKNTTAP